MNKKQVLVIFLIALIAYSPIFFRALPFGTDPYYFLANVCQNKGLETQSIATNIIFSALPCNFIGIQLLYFALCFLSSYFCAKTAILFNPKSGYLAGIFVFATPLWLMEFWNIENEPFAYTLIFTGAYFFYKGLQTKKTKPKIIGIALVLLAQTIWDGSVLWLIAFSLSWIWIALPILPLLALNFPRFAAKISPIYEATESVPGFGLLYQTFLLYGLIAWQKIPLMIAPLTFFILIALINMKLAVHASFILAIFLTMHFEQTKTKIGKTMPIAGTIIAILFMAIIAPSLPPTPEQAEAAQLAVAEAKGETICNDWGTGHWVNFWGGKPLAKSGGKQLCYGCQNCIILSFREFDCPIISKKKTELDLKVYKCT